MKLLLDTHVWFWVQDDPGKLGPTCRVALLRMDNELFVSAVSTMELARLTAQGRLDVGKDLLRWTEDGMRACGAVGLALDHACAIEAYRLPGSLHRDPADRLLIAQARLHNLRLVTADEQILRYPHVRHVDARR